MMKHHNIQKTAFILFLFCLAGTLYPQQFPDSISIGVIYFDFHSNGSCPDFNPQDSKDFVTKNMVKPTLDSAGRPVRGTRVYFSQYIENWFRSWDGHLVKNRKPVYVKGTNPNTDTTHGSLASESQVGYDTGYKNIVINDSLGLTFKHTGNGIYEYKNSAFFPLDKKGFGKEPTKRWDGQIVQDHNYSFSMMLERQFIYRKGLVLRFGGDEDLWVFIDNKLVLDIGGIHMGVEDTLSLDNIAGALGLVLAQKYKLSVFYCERQANTSFIRISTNLVAAVPIIITPQTNKPVNSVILDVHIVPFGNTMQILIDGSSAEGAMIALYSVKGQHVTTLHTIQSKSLWDYKDFHGNRVAPGIFIVKVTGKKGFTVARTIVP
jgi:fibro-slime domain-containing protein